MLCLLQAFLRGEGKHPRNDQLIRKDDKNYIIFFRSSYKWLSLFPKLFEFVSGP